MQLRLQNPCSLCLSNKIKKNQYKPELLPDVNATNSSLITVTERLTEAFEGTTIGSILSALKLRAIKMHQCCFIYFLHTSSS